MKNEDTASQMATGGWSIGYAILVIIIASTEGCGTDSRLSEFNLTPVRSSALDTIGYSDDRQALFLEFDNGGKYIFHDVPRSIYDDMRNAPSKGVFFHTNIRGRYDYYRLDR